MERRSGNRTLQERLPLVLGGAALLIVAGTIGLLKPIQSLIGLILEPVAKTVQITGKSDLEKKNQALQKQVAELTTQLANQREDTQRLQTLKGQIDFAQANRYKLAEAKIISQDPTNYRQILTIDRGSASGIKKGQIAVTRGLLVGQVTATTPSTAKIRLITDFRSTVPVLDQQSRATGLVHGGSGFSLDLDMVPQTDRLLRGDTLITSGFAGEYPKGLVVGTVDTTEKRDTDVFQTGEVKPAVDFRRLEDLFIIIGRS